MAVINGSCSMDGPSCVQSPNRPKLYDNNEECVISVLSAGSLSADSFNTEANYDKLTINSVNYSGTNGPQGVTISAGGLIKWESDFSNIRTGWRLCWSAEDCQRRFTPRFYNQGFTPRICNSGKLLCSIMQSNSLLTRASVPLHQTSIFVSKRMESLYVHKMMPWKLLI